ncbi:MAG: hypothetical protein F6K58_02435 [Symploca sp. SIO2E9]|nr:hypothetical protein [Symploca sp. SIO2E9]
MATAIVRSQRATQNKQITYFVEAFMGDLPIAYSIVQWREAPSLVKCLDIIPWRFSDDFNAENRREYRPQTETCK